MPGGGGDALGWQPAPRGLSEDAGPPDGAGLAGMISKSMPVFAQAAEALEELGVSTGAAEAHGELCGLACVLGSRATEAWLAGLGEAAGAGQAVAALELLRDMAGLSCEVLAEGAMRFNLLLPPDDELLAARTQALGDWCSGFLAGLGAVATSQAARAVLQGDTGREIIGDLAEIARATLDQAEPGAEDEVAYAEVVEFVRVGAQLIFDELHAVRRTGTSDHLH